MNRRVLLFTLLVVALASTVESSPIRLADQFALDPDSRLTFATAVVSYDPVFVDGGTVDWAVPSKALGSPDYANKQNFTSLGLGGSLVLAFGENALTGSGTSAPDLIVSEVGPDVEDTFAWISRNGIDWVSLGRVAGGTTGVDIDALGFGVDDVFAFVRLVDDPNQGLREGLTVGADIDSVAAVSATAVPEPGAFVLLATGLVGIAVRVTRRARH